MMLILLRHGQSQWNLQNRFTGWVDVPLSVQGIKEAQQAGERIAELPIDQIFVSSLIRSQMTALIAMATHRGGKVPQLLHSEGPMQAWGGCYDSAATTLPVTVAWQLNERYYGQLQGLDKQATIERYGAQQVQLWRRSYSVPPPGGESLKDTAARTLPYFRQVIEPALMRGEHLLLCAHGNSLRSIAMAIEGVSEQQVAELEIPTGQPLLYECSIGSKLRYQRRSL